MHFFIHKTLAFLDKKFRIPPISSSVTPIQPVSEIKKILQTKKPFLFRKARNQIENYKKKAQQSSLNSLDEAILWQYLFKHKNYQALKAILEYDQKLLSLFENSHDISLFTHTNGLRKVLKCLFLDDNYRILLQRFTPTQLFSIINTDGSSAVLKILINPDNWSFLTTFCKLSIQNIVKISRQVGAKNVFEIFLNPKHWHTLTNIYNLDKNSIVKIANHRDAKNVFEILLNPKYWHTLTNVYKLDTRHIVKISNNKTARNSLDILLDLSKWKILIETYQLDIDTIIQITSTTCAKDVLTILMTPKNWETLTQTYRFTVNEIRKITCKNGSKNVLNILLNPENWKTLTDVYQLDVASIAKISSQDGARKTLELLLDPKNWTILTKTCQLDVNSIVKITSHHGIKKILAILLNPDNWKTLTERCHLDSNQIVKIASHDGAMLVFKIILNENNWRTLTETYQLDTDSIVNISAHSGARHVLEILLNPKNWYTLTNVYHFDHTTIAKIANNDGAKKTFKLLLDPQNWKTLTQDLGFDTCNIVSICSQHISGSILEILLDPQKYTLLCSIFGKNNLFNLASSQRSSRHFSSFIQAYDQLKQYFNQSSMTTILQLSTRDQQGLLSIFKSPLKNALSFSNQDILSLAKISGRYLPHIFNLIYTHTEDIASLFSGYGLPITHFLPSSHYISLANLSHKDHWVLSLANLHQHCLNDPLSLDDLKFLRNSLPLMLNHDSRMNHLKHLIRTSAKANSKDRLTIWNTLSPSIRTAQKRPFPTELQPQLKKARSMTDGEPFPPPPIQYPFEEVDLLSEFSPLNDIDWDLDTIKDIPSQEDSPHTNNNLLQSTNSNYLGGEQILKSPNNHHRTVC